jgi:hypothetical protein
MKLINAMALVMLVAVTGCAKRPIRWRWSRRRTHRVKCALHVPGANIPDSAPRGQGLQY